MDEYEDVIASGPIEPGTGTPGDVAPIGLNKPLLIRIQQIYTGPNSSGQALVTSAVKSVATYNRAPYAVNSLHRRAQPSTFLPPVIATEPGSPIVYYAKACLDSSLALQVRVSYDRFDEARYNNLVEVMAQVAELPVFVSSLNLGPAGAAGGHAVVLAVKRAAKVVVGAWNRAIDGHEENDFIANVTLDLDTPGLAHAQAGWFLMRDDDASGELFITPGGSGDGDPQWSNEDSAFMVQDGKLHYKETGRLVDDLDQGFVLLHISGTEKSELDGFQPAAATTAMLDKFLDVKGDLLGDIGELASAYNDIEMTKRITALDHEIAGSNGDAKTKLLERRAATLKLIQDDDVRELIPAPAK